MTRWTVKGVHYCRASWRPASRCFAGPASAATELTVIVYGGSFEAGWKKAVIEPFEAANPDIKVRIATGLTMETVAMMRAQKGDPKIDVIMMDEVGAAQANSEGLYAAARSRHHPEHGEALSAVSDQRRPVHQVHVRGPGDRLRQEAR